MTFCQRGVQPRRRRLLLHRRAFTRQLGFTCGQGVSGVKPCVRGCDVARFQHEQVAWTTLSAATMTP